MRESHPCQIHSPGTLELNLGIGHPEQHQQSGLTASLGISYDGDRAPLRTIVHDRQTAALGQNNIVAGISTGAGTLALEETTAGGTAGLDRIEMVQPVATSGSAPLSVSRRGDFVFTRRRVREGELGYDHELDRD
ncbi:hypothetical protein EXIGLDRAFT_722265 [Exidia glandulosa HHB12029]|uniref:Uncharacterized protein n=1 Tax=Exidia glandulosa HHB12029 TaxID=1314781 RepID=A0A165N4J9_EXIGL|nr:hypothetical protein EXIGLDRAFT_722265 [Exidia glandulosa HHB12029]